MERQARWAGGVGNLGSWSGMECVSWGPMSLDLRPLNSRRLKMGDPRLIASPDGMPCNV